MNILQTNVLEKWAHMHFWDMTWRKSTAGPSEPGWGGGGGGGGGGEIHLAPRFSYIT